MLFKRSSKEKSTIIPSEKSTKYPTREQNSHKSTKPSEDGMITFPQARPPRTTGI
jgi:hypothetical protein